MAPPKAVCRDPRGSPADLSSNLSQGFYRRERRRKRAVPQRRWALLKAGFRFLGTRPDAPGPKDLIPELGPVVTARPDSIPRKSVAARNRSRIPLSPFWGERGESRVRDEAYCWVIFTSSTAASTRLAVDASAASMRMRTVWPAKALMLAEVVAHTAASVVAEPSSWNTCVVVEPTTLTRRKSALEELLRCAR